MLKLIITYSLIIITTFHPLWKVVIFLSFKYQQRYIIENLCENRERPELNCDGHCQLTKQLKEAEQQEKSQQIAEDIAEYPLFISEMGEICLPSPRGQSIDFNTCSLLFAYQHHKGIFHPPRLA